MAADPSPLDRYLGTPEFEAFAATIAAAPADEAPRLVLSDWLREQGDDAAADLAAGPTFATLLAFARFRGAVAGSGVPAVRHLGDRFRGVGGAVRVRMMPYIERHPQVAIVDAEPERPRLARRTLEWPGRRLGDAAAGEGDEEMTSGSQRRGPRGPQRPNGKIV